VRRGELGIDHAMLIQTANSSIEQPHIGAALIPQMQIGVFSQVQCGVIDH